MIWRILLLSCCLCLAISSQGQLRQKKSYEERHLSLPDRSLQFQIAAKDVKVNVDNHLVYYWVKGAELHHSRGGYEGRVLHGNFAAFYPNRQLKSRGRFHKGVKHGEWKTWYENGELKTIAVWRKGVQHGSHYSYSSDGRLEHVAKYKKGQLHGKQIDYLIGDVENTVIYKKGEPRPSTPEKPEIIEGEVETPTSDLEAKQDTTSFFRRIFKRKPKRIEPADETPEEEDPKESRDNFLKRIFKKKKAKTDDE